MPSRDLELEFVRLVTDPDDHSRAWCPSCHDHLAVHQPDIELPDCLLAVCPGCHDWFLVEAGAEVMARLPHWDALRASWPSSPPDGSRSVPPGR
jgi:hypothetical protein